MRSIYGDLNIKDTRPYVILLVLSKTLRNSLSQIGTAGSCFDAYLTGRYSINSRVQEGLSDVVWLTSFVLYGNVRNFVHLHNRPRVPCWYNCRVRNFSRLLPKGG